MVHTALLIIDVFNTFEFVNGDKLRTATMQIVKPILTLKQLAKQKNYPTIYINDYIDTESIPVNEFMAHFFHEKERDFLVPLKPTPTDTFLLKKKFSAFFDTELNAILHEKKIQRLILTGVAGHICVLFTANDAYMRGYQLVTPIDAYACEGTIQKIFTDEMFENVFKSQMCPAHLVT